MYVYMCVYLKEASKTQINQSAFPPPLSLLSSYLARVLHAFITNLIVDTTLVGVRERLVRFRHLGETLRGCFFLSFRVLVRVVFHGQLWGRGGREGGRKGAVSGRHRCQQIGERNRKMEDEMERRWLGRMPPSNKRVQECKLTPHTYT